MILSPTDTVFNENSGDIDFRVESNGNTHMLFVDAGNDKLFIAKSSDNDNTAGHTLHSTGLVVHTRDSSFVSILNRTTDDGDILQFKKDGTLVGSIGSALNSSSYLNIGSGDVNLYFFDDSTPAFLPRKANDGASDGYADLGNTGNRFKDLYLSGSIVNSSDITLDAAGDIILDADGAQVRFKDAGTEFFVVSNESAIVQLYSPVSNSDIDLVGNDGGS